MINGCFITVSKITASKFMFATQKHRSTSAMPTRYNRCYDCRVPLTYVEPLLIPAALGESFGAGDARLQFVVALVQRAALCCYAFAFGGHLIAYVLRHRTSRRARSTSPPA